MRRWRNGNENLLFGRRLADFQYPTFHFLYAHVKIRLALNCPINHPTWLMQRPYDLRVLRQTNRVHASEDYANR